MTGAAEEAFHVALQTVTTAAQAATAALAEIKRFQATGLVSKPKELEFTGRPEEDRRLWSDWKFAAVQYLMTKDVMYQEEIKPLKSRLRTQYTWTSSGKLDAVEASSCLASWPERSKEDSLP